MKFHALALCLAGSLAAGAAAADHNKDHHKSCAECGYAHSDQYPFFREVMFPDMPSVAEVASKVRQFNEDNRREAAMLRAHGSHARTVGFENVPSVYEYMAQDHDRAAAFTGEWLNNHGITVTVDPVVQPAADITPETSVAHMIEHHAQMYNQAKASLENEKSSYVRGLRLMTMSTALRHISLLNTLDRDMDMGRKTLSARLQGEMDNTLVAGSREEWISRVITEDTEYWARFTPAPTPYVVVQTPDTETTVTRETTTVITPAPVVTERIVEKPVYVERVVEKPVYITRPEVRSQVAGRRQTTRRAGVRARRPAK